MAVISKRKDILKFFYNEYIVMDKKLKVSYEETVEHFKNVEV